MNCINTITSTSNTLKNFLLNKISHSSYIKKIFNEKEEIINTIFSSYVEPLLKNINHPALLQERKLNLDAASYEKNDANAYKPSAKREIDLQDRDLYWPTSIKDRIQWFTFITIMKHTENDLKPSCLVS